MKSDEPMKASEILETIVILVALASLVVVVYWWHTGDLADHRLYFYYLVLMLSILGYITYRRIKRLRAAFKATENKGPGPRIPPFFK